MQSDFFFSNQFNYTTEHLLVNFVKHLLAWIFCQTIMTFSLLLVNMLAGLSS